MEGRAAARAAGAWRRAALSQGARCRHRCEVGRGRRDAREATLGRRALAARRAASAAHLEESFSGSGRAAVAARAAAASLSRRGAGVGARAGYRCALQKPAEKRGLHPGMAANLLKLQIFLVIWELFWM